MTNTKAATMMVLLRPYLDFVRVNKRITYMTDEILPRRILLIRSFIGNAPSISDSWGSFKNQYFWKSLSSYDIPHNTVSFGNDRNWISIAKGNPISAKVFVMVKIKELYRIHRTTTSKKSVQAYYISHLKWCPAAKRCKVSRLVLWFLISCPKPGHSLISLLPDWGLRGRFHLTLTSCIDYTPHLVVKKFMFGS